MTGDEELYMDGSVNESGMKNMKLPLNVPSVIFICFFLAISVWEGSMGSTNVLSTNKLVFVLFYVMVIYYFGGDKNDASGAWVLLITYIICYLTITIVSTSCAKYNIRQLADLRDVGLLSPFVLDKRMLEKIGKRPSKTGSSSIFTTTYAWWNDDDDEDDEVEMTEDELLKIIAAKKALSDVEPYRSF